MFFRFNRLYELGIRPVFVFDGVNRPEYKRNKYIKTLPYGTTFRRNLIQMIRLFNFSMWEAYGEAEAECAMLERLGFVDMVFTGDSDVFLFGARRVVRQWPGKRHEAVPCYDMTWITDATGLDRSDLILIALLRGCDYDTQGTKGVGVNVAAQLSKCHFHRKFMDDIQLSGRDETLDEERVQHLFDDLTYELHNNGTKNLNKKHTKVILDRKFFDFRIVIDFIHPPTNIAKDDKSSIGPAQRLRANLDNYVEPDWINLAAFAQNSFGWPAEYLIKRFSSLLYHAYMSNKLRKQQPSYIKLRRNQHKITSSRSSSQQQTQLQDFYRSTPRLHTLNETDKCDLVQITASKLTSDKIKQYRVEWDCGTYDTFIEYLKIKLNFDTFKDTIIEDDMQEGEEEAEVIDIEKDTSKKEKDVWQLVKRQWVDATHIHHAYPSIALQYQERKAKSKNKNSNSNSNSSQTKIDTFLIIPPRRTPLSRK
jgi:5'-3' exonuclease